jgi:hypothetical protein
MTNKLMARVVWPNAVATRGNPLESTDVFDGGVRFGFPVVKLYNDQGEYVADLAHIQEVSVSIGAGGEDSFQEVSLKLIADAYIPLTDDLKDELGQ